MTDKEKKKCKYMISILGEQILDDESDRIEVLTEGNFLMKKDHCYIGYKEYDEDAPQSFLRQSHQSSGQYGDNYTQRSHAFTAYA